MSTLDRAFENIVSQLPGYEPRPQQIQMARLVEKALESGRHAIIEAGTGSGKSFGYLIPVLEAGKRVVISTGTIALQEQLLHKDIPFLSQAYGREIKAAIAKGRSNYVCIRRMMETHQHLPVTDVLRPQVEQLLQLLDTGEWSGDRADLPFMIEGRGWADLLASDGEDCLGPRCANWGHTPHRVARLACEEAQVIIANHALYLTDLATEAGILPQHDIVVFDEAQHLDRAAIGAFSVEIQRWMATKLLQRVQRRFPNCPAALLQDLQDAELDFMDEIFKRGKGQFRMEPEPESQLRAGRMGEVLSRLGAYLATVDTQQMQLLADDPQVAKSQAESVRDQMQSVASGMASAWGHFAQIAPPVERATYMVLNPERDHYELHSSPLDIGPILHSSLWGGRPAVLTSATLAVDGKFDFLRQELGLPADVLEACLGSPFSYGEQALLYVPRHLPVPAEADFLAEAANEIEKILAMTHGRAFVLCTSYRSLRELAGMLVGRVPWPCKTQEELPRARLIEWFKTTPNAVLFATATFWEGVDVPGEALSCVIIDKLPFASPDDPIVQARTERMKLKDEDWFGGYMLPRATLTLKQGFGRLIRTRSDRGIVAILDRRLLTHRYGDSILRSLPDARRITRLAEDLDAAFASAPPAPRPQNRPSGVGRPSGPREARESWSGHGVDYQPAGAPPPDLDAVLGEPLP